MTFYHKNIRLPAANYQGQRWYFVTLCCAARRPLFTNTARVYPVIEELRQQATAHQFDVHAFCVMPDHLHALVRGHQATSDLLALMKTLKQKTVYDFQRKFRRSLWQKKFHNHILRPNESPEGVAAYIWMNPVRKGLCKDAREYPYSGSFAFAWRNVAPPAESWVPSWKSDGPA